MIIFLYGEDSYRSKEKLSEVIDRYKASQKSGLNLVYINAGQTDFTDFYDSLRNSAMFFEKKLIILRNLFSDKKFQEIFLENLKKLKSLEDVIVIYEEDAVDQRLKVFKELVKECKSQEFKLLDGIKLKNWIQKGFENYGQKINADALDLLLNYVGNDLWRASNEIKKLVNFSASAKGADVSSGWKKDSAIKKEDVELQVKSRIETDIFKTIDALASKNKKQAFMLLQKHLNNGDNPLYLLSMIAYQFKNLLIVKELAEKRFMYASIVKKSGLHPFVVKKNYFACQQFSFLELKEIYCKIFKVDSDIKSGKIEQETALDLLISQI